MPSDARFSPLGVYRIQIASSREHEAMRCFRHFPYLPKGGECAVFAARGRSKGTRVRVYNPGHSRPLPPRLQPFDTFLLIKPNQTIPNHTKPNQTKPNQTFKQSTKQQCRAVNPKRPRSSRPRADARKSPSSLLISPPSTDNVSFLHSLATIRCGTKCSPVSGSEACSCPGQCTCAGCPNRKTEAVDSDPKEGCS